MDDSEIELTITEGTGSGAETEGEREKEETDDEEEEEAEEADEEAEKGEDGAKTAEESPSDKGKEAQEESGSTDASEGNKDTGVSADGEAVEETSEDAGGEEADEAQPLLDHTETESAGGGKAGEERTTDTGAGVAALVLGGETEEEAAAAAAWGALEEAQAEQDQAEEAHKSGTIRSKEDLGQAGLVLNYNDVLGHFEKQDMSEVLKTVTRESEPQYEGCQACWYSLFGCCTCCDSELSADNQDARDLVLAMAATPLDGDDRVHSRIIISIYRKLTGSQRDCPRYGAHWQDIGFQDTDPKTDLRSAGMFGLLQLLSLLQQHKQLAQEVYTLSQDSEQEFPMSVVSLNFTVVCIQALREGRLNQMANKHEGGLLGVLAELHAACFADMLAVWKRDHCTITDFGPYKNDITKRAKNDPAGLIKAMEEIKDKASKKQAKLEAEQGEEIEFG